ncbi:hypothetical protein DFH09DRAFT_1087139 [Mycena vulgaris]|nr:hypothetical protein DFH09DRAFT_1087139 [Mycena vulgaris]
MDVDVDVEYSTDEDEEAVPVVETTWLDLRCPESPMPMQNATNSAHRGVLIDPPCLERNLVVTCRKCAAALQSDKVPPRAVANHNDLGPVPIELESLTVVEEAMITLCRTKCWIIDAFDEERQGVRVKESWDAFKGVDG